MKFKKAITVVCALAAAAIFAPKANAQAPTNWFIGAGSSALFNTLADAANTAGIAGTACGTRVWTNSTHKANVVDTRNASINVVNGNTWIIWDSDTAPTKICVYVSVDSVAGDRAFFGRDTNGLPAVVQLETTSAGSAGSGLVPTLTDVALPTIVYNYVQYYNNGAPTSPCYGNSGTTGCGTVTGTPMNGAATDIRPEDAEYATARNLTVINPNPFNRAYGLGYGNWGCISCGGTLAGTAIVSSHSGSSLQPVFFETGFVSTDPYTHKAIGPWQTIDVGTAPILILASNDDTSATGLGQNAPGTPAGQAGPYLLKNIDKFIASYTFDGILTRTRDLIPGTGLASTPLEVITRESLSGTYNTFEFSVPASYTVQASQEDSADPAGNPGTWNPLNFTAASGGERVRAVGTSEMIKVIAGSLSPKAGLTVTKLANRIGYAFWSYGNVAPLIGTYASGITGGPVYAANPKAHYLTYDGVDPLFDSRKDNPQGENNPPICNPTNVANVNLPPCVALPFTHLADGSYGIWSVLRLVTFSPAPASVAGIQGSLPSSAVKFYDFFPDNGRLFLHGHRDDSQISNSTGRNGNPAYCTTESGKDVGGAVFSYAADFDWEVDGGGGSTPNAGCAPGTGFVNQRQ